MKPTLLHVACAVLAAGAWLLGQPERASAQQGWSGVATTLDLGYWPVVVVDPAGVVTAAWRSQTVRAARRQPDAAEWGPAVNISPLGQGGGVFAGPELVADPFGNLIAAWVWRFETGPVVVQAARFAAATGVWGPAMSLSKVSVDERIRIGALATDASGNVTVVWWRGQGAYPEPPTDLWTVQAARYVATTGAWSDAVDISAPGHGFAGGLLAVSPGGDVTAIWNRADGLAPALRQTVQAARFTVASGTWGPARDLSTPTTPSSLPLLDPWAPVIDLEGTVTVAWWRGDVAASEAPWMVQAARYTPASDGWSPAASLAPATAFPPAESSTGRLRVDPGGTVTAIWTRVDEIGTNPREVVVASRYPRANGRWATATELSAPALDAGSLSLVVSPRGDATAIWSSWDGAVWKVQGVRYPSGGSEWSAVVDVAVFGPGPQTPTPLPSTGPRDPRPDAVGDDEGNIFVYWVVAREGWYVVVAPEGLQGVRFTAATNALSGPQWLSRLTDRDSVLRSRLVIDSTGRATVVWNTCMDNRCGGLSIQSTRWLPTPGAPSVTAASPGNGSLTMAFDAPTTIDPAFAPTNYEYSLDDGLTWTPRLPPSDVSPLRISGLINGTPYNVRLRALNVAGAGAASAATPVLPPDRPTGLTVLARSGHVVTVNWTPPGGGLSPTGYVLEGGLQPGQVLASVPTAASPTLFTFEAPIGVFYIRIHAVAAGVWSAPSNEIRLVVDVPAAPSAPTNLLGLVNGSSVALSWTNTYDGGTPVILGLRVTGAVNTILPMPFGDTFTLPGVPPGTYTLSVVAANANGISLPSNPVTLSFPGACSGAPEAPASFQALKAGSTILVSWSPPASGPAATSYIVRVNGAYVDSFTTTARMLSGVAGPGTYTLTVQASNACGTSSTTPRQTVVFP